MLIITIIKQLNVENKIKIYKKIINKIKIIKNCKLKNILIKKF